MNIDTYMVCDLWNIPLTILLSGVVVHCHPMWHKLLNCEIFSILWLEKPAYNLSHKLGCYNICKRWSCFGIVSNKVVMLIGWMPWLCRQLQCVASTRFLVRAINIIQVSLFEQYYYCIDTPVAICGWIFFNLLFLQSSFSFCHCYSCCLIISFSIYD